MPSPGLVANARQEDGQEDGQTDPETVLAWVNECRSPVLRLLQRLAGQRS